MELADLSPGGGLPLLVACLTDKCENVISKSSAAVVELADAPDSKSGGGNPVPVQFRPAAVDFT